MSSTPHSLWFGPSLVMLGLICQEVGASLAVSLFPQVGAIGMVAIRLIFTALILAVLARPALKVVGTVAWRTVVAFGIALAGMNIFFYLSLERLPLGVAVTIETLGPLVLSVIVGRRWINVVWALLAAVGVALLGGGMHDLDPLGVVFALLAAALWAGYILLSRATGAHFPGISGLAVATVIGAVPTALIASQVTEIGALLNPAILVAGLGIAVLSSALPYALELLALRRTSASTFAILLALAPAVAGAAGFFILDQTLTMSAIAGMACVVGASVGAIGAHGRSRGYRNNDVRGPIAPAGAGEST